MRKKIDIVLLAGFLGAGKTTVLNELILQFHDIKLGMLVNDFGEVPVDGTLLKNDNPEILDKGHKIYEIGNGSIFCSCLKVPFLSGLQYFEKERPDLLFLEASGLSDPSSMDKILKEHHLDEAFQIRKTLTLIDPLNYGKLVHVLNVIGRQVESADVLLINKEDMVSSEEMNSVKDNITALNPDAPVQTGSFGRFDYSFLKEKGCGHQIFERESCNTPDSRPASLFLEGSVQDRSCLMEFLETVEGDIYRLKGFFELEEKMHYVSDTGRGFSITPVEKSGIKPGLTVLCPGENSKKVWDLWKNYRSDTFSVFQGNRGFLGQLSAIK
ncbi:MAG: hypothetical protein B6241_09215 [Spirochaetaceae bacterium 4572_59]|nr:MAG: hypothetical protein B6241_09215 [Spirochaetaceae bacterium 4572_59]